MRLNFLVIPLGLGALVTNSLDTIQYQTETEELIFYIGKAYKESWKLEGLKFSRKSAASVILLP